MPPEEALGEGGGELCSLMIVKCSMVAVWFGAVKRDELADGSGRNLRLRPSEYLYWKSFLRRKR